MRKKVAIAVNSTGGRPADATMAVAEGIMRWAEQENVELIDLCSWYWEVPSKLKIDGLIYQPALLEHQKLKNLVEDVPCSVQLTAGKDKATVRGVDVDWQAVGLQAAEYFLDRGFRNFALAAYLTDEWTLSLKVFKERIEKAGGQCQTIQGMNLSDGNMDAVRDTVRTQLRALSTPLGIFCENDRLAVRLCRWCMEEGLAVPEQAAILGYSNDPIACQSNPVPLSSVNPNLEQHGFEAGLLLQRMMEGEAIPAGTIIRVPPKGIVTRRSTDITAIEDARVARALRYIWDHYKENIGPDDVAAFSGIPRRSLDRHFKKVIGRTIMREVLRERLAKACDLLATSQMSSVDIAARVGFRTPQYFNFQFRKHFGVTPQRYRKQDRQKH